MVSLKNKEIFPSKLFFRKECKTLHLNGLNDKKVHANIELKFKNCQKLIKKKIELIFKFRECV